MIKVYVAGPYSADNVVDVLKNIGRGEHMAGLLFSKGYAPFCPWLDNAFVINHWFEDFSVQQFKDYSMEWLKVCDCVLLVDGWSKSKGTIAEMAEAKKLGIPVLYTVYELEQWRKLNNEK